MFYRSVPLWEACFDHDQDHFKELGHLRFPRKIRKKYISSVLYIYILFVASICWFEPNEIPYLTWLMFEPSVPQLSSSMGVVLLPGELQRKEKNVKPRRSNQFPWVTRKSIPQTQNDRGPTHRFSRGLPQSACS